MDSKADIRHDEEQQKKGQEIVELLVAAGYFRARIKGLSDFDKVVGGLVWCIEVCSVDIDVDLLFQEELSIGKKISLTEKIVSVVSQMQCPFAIEPHQIQGLDYIHIFPVVQWLVTKAIETRQNEGDKIRRAALNEYHKNSPLDDSLGMKIDQQREIKRQYRPKDPEQAPINIEQTLMEYGQRTSRSKQVEQSKTDTLVKEDQVVTNAKEAVKDLIDAQVLSNAAEKYSLMKDQLEQDPKSLLKAIKILEEEKQTYEERLKNVTKETTDFETLLVLAKERTDKLVAELDDTDHKLAEQELPTDKEELLGKLQKLVGKNEMLKQKETEFKEQCRKEMDELMKENEQLEQELEGLKIHQPSNEAPTEEEKKLLEKLNKKLYSINGQVQSLERQIDAVPSRYELAQYQKRFVELDNQVAAEYCETQKFVIMYNTLQDQLVFMDKEVNLLNSIYDGIPDAKLSSVSAKHQFIHQLQQIHLSVHQSKAKIEQTLDDHQSKEETVKSELNKLTELQRQYLILVRDMTEEMKKNEFLSTE